MNVESKASYFVGFVKKNAVMFVALIAALITSFIIPPDEAYIDYIDFKTITCLFCVLAVVCALKNIRFFYTIAKKIVRLFKNARMSVLALVYITFIGSMLIANDMALLTFLPLGYFVLTTTNKQKYTQKVALGRASQLYLLPTSKQKVADATLANFTQKVAQVHT